MEIDKKTVWYFFVLILSIFNIGVAQKNVDTIVVKLDYLKYDSIKFLYINKEIEYFKSFKNEGKKEHLLFKYYSLDSLKISTVPRFKLISNMRYCKKNSFINYIDFKQDILNQTIFFDSNEGFLVGMNIINKFTFENSYKEFDNLYLIKDFNDLMRGGGSMSYNLFKRYDKNFNTFQVEGFNGDFILENGILYYALIYRVKNDRTIVNIDNIKLDGQKLPDNITDKKVEFNTYIRKCFCEKDINAFLSTGRFIDNYECFKRINRNILPDYYIVLYKD